MQCKEPAMKNATLPPLRVDGALRSAAESVLREGETLSGFMLEAVRLNIERRQAQHEFIARGLLAREEARATGDYVNAEDMLARLDASLARARSKQASGAQ
jgi:predicted transcriptional regulator